MSSNLKKKKKVSLLNGIILLKIIFPDIVFSSSDTPSGIWKLFTHCHFFLSFSPDSEEQP